MLPAVNRISYRAKPAASNAVLNRLFKASWPNHRARDFQPMLRRSLTHVCAYDARRLVGFVNVAWDGDKHAFLLDTTVHPSTRRCGIGSELVRRAAELTKQAGAEWLHVDFEAELTHFYRVRGFRSTRAGLIHFSGAIIQRRAK
jgi:ribosomal protein S18 acetylase RimI-like enzyme